MISAAATMQMPGQSPSVGRNWMKANVIAALVSSGAGILMIAAEMLPGANVSGSVMRFVGANITFFAAAMSMIAYAMLTAPVLTAKLPKFSRRGWILMHGALGIVMGLALGSLMFFGDGSRDDLTPLQMAPAVMLLAIAFGGVVGLLIGATMGALQAVVLRKAARGVSGWIKWSMLSGGVAVAIVAMAVFVGPALTKGTAFTLVTEICTFAGMMIAAVIMLPAVNGLKPRA